MTCNGCRSHVEQTLSKVDGVIHISVNLEKAEAAIEMESHIPIETFQKALQDDGGSYSIHKFVGQPDVVDQPDEVSASTGTKGTGTFYCPMHCEADKTYSKS
ncbi:MAG: Cu2+-exporting ATPase, partial [Nonlabens sp.]